jgi:hypothetical protein
VITGGCRQGVVTISESRPPASTGSLSCTFCPSGLDWCAGLFGNRLEATIAPPFFEMGGSVRFDKGVEDRKEFFPGSRYNIIFLIFVYAFPIVCRD